jgi:DNA-binding MarR family transcriptional regulator
VTDLLAIDPVRRPAPVSSIPAKLHSANAGPLTGTWQLIIDQLKGGPSEIRIIATSLGISPHSLLDHVDPLIDAGLIVETDDGNKLALSD